MGMGTSWAEGQGAGSLLGVRQWGHWLLTSTRPVAGPGSESVQLRACPWGACPDLPVPVGQGPALTGSLLVLIGQPLPPGPPSAPASGLLPRSSRMMCHDRDMTLTRERWACLLTLAWAGLPGALGGIEPGVVLGASQAIGPEVEVQSAILALGTQRRTPQETQAGCGEAAEARKLRAVGRPQA